MSAARKPFVAAKVFGERVRAHRQSLGWTLEQLGDTSGLHWTYIGQVERGGRNLSLNNILRLAAALGVDPGVLVEGLEPG